MNETTQIKQFVSAMNSTQPRNVVLQPHGKFIKRCRDWNHASILAARLVAHIPIGSPNYYGCYTDAEAGRFVRA